MFLAFPLNFSHSCFVAVLFYNNLKFGLFIFVCKMIRLSLCLQIITGLVVKQILWF
jgi:hypothetical protein